MVSEIKLIISENEKVIHKITKEINSQQSLVKSLEEFQHAANAKITRMIEESCESGDEEMQDEGDSCDDDEEEDKSILPKKRKR